jgi:hypothetical protein
LKAISFLISRAEKEVLNEKMKGGEKEVEMDDSGFYAGKDKH